MDETHGSMRKYGYSSPERSRRSGEPAPTPPPKQQRHRNPHHYQQQQQQQQQHELQQGMRIPVVYYLCRNRHLEQPHFIEVPISSPKGLYLRDVIIRLNALRGKGMAGLYSWSCKRSYKNGFVWHDLSDDDPVLPAQGNEYVLKGSELFDSSPPDRSHESTSGIIKLQNTKIPHPQPEHSTPSRSQDSSPSSSSTVVREENPPRPLPQSPLRPPQPEEDEMSPTAHRPGSSDDDGSLESKRNSSQGSGGSPVLADYKLHEPNLAADASTQTDERSGGGERRPHVRETRISGVSTDEGLLDHELEDTNHSGQSSRLKDVSPPPTSSSPSSSGGKTETLESLIRADARRMNNFKILEEEEVLIPLGAKLKATNVLMQLITCGSISVKDHHSFGIVPSYKPRFSHVNFPSPVFGSSVTLGELDYLSHSSRFTGLRLEEKEYFSGSIIETKRHKEEQTAVPALKRSSSYNAERNCNSPDPAADKSGMVNSGRLKCLPRAIKLSSCKHSKNDTTKSPISDGPRISSEGPGCSSRGSSKRFTDASSAKGSSSRLESFREDKEKVIKIEERLTSGARVIIQSRAPCDDSEGSSSS